MRSTALTLMLLSQPAACTLMDGYVGFSGSGDEVRLGGGYEGLGGAHGRRQGGQTCRASPSSADVIMACHACCVTGIRACSGDCTVSVSSEHTCCKPVARLGTDRWHPHVRLAGLAAVGSAEVCCQGGGGKQTA